MWAIFTCDLEMRYHSYQIIRRYTNVLFAVIEKDKQREAVYDCLFGKQKNKNQQYYQIFTNLSSVEPVIITAVLYNL